MSDFFTPDSNNLLDINGAIAPWNPSLEPTNGIIPQLEANRALTGVGSQEVNAQILTPDTSDNIILPDASLSQITNETITDSNISLTDSAVDVLTGQAMSEVYEDLSKFAAQADFVPKMNLAFGENWDAASAKALAEGWFHQDFSDIPSVKVVSSAEIGGANGAFAEATDTIYLSRELVSGGNLGAIADVLLEEVGHSVDARLNVTDSPGDEGVIFAAVVQGKELSEGELLGLKGESDRANFVLGGKDTLIEMSQQRWTIRRYADFKNRNLDWQKPDGISIQNSERLDGKDGIYINWGTGSPFDSSFISGQGNNADYFATLGRTNTYFEGGKTYKFRVNADDGFILSAQLTGQSRVDWITPLGWQNNFDGGGFKEYIWTPTQSGFYDVDFYHYEETGNAGVDISWEKVSNSVPGTGTVEKNGTKRQVEIKRFDGSLSDITDTPTWVIIHGFRLTPQDVETQGLPQAIEKNQPSDQILELDWKDITKTDYQNVNDVASWIPIVGEFAKNKLIGLGISPNNINLVGHSFGSYVAWEIANRIGGVNKLVALDPANRLGGVSTVGGAIGNAFGSVVGGPVGGAVGAVAGGLLFPNYDVSKVDFKNNSNWSWAFKSSQLGDEAAALTADESFDVSLSGVSDTHNDIMQMFATLINREFNNGGGKLFSLDTMTSWDNKPWRRSDNQFEAWIEASKNGDSWSNQVRIP